MQKPSGGRRKIYARGRDSETDTWERERERESLKILKQKIKERKRRKRGDERAAREWDQRQVRLKRERMKKVVRGEMCNKERFSQKTEDAITGT